MVPLRSQLRRKLLGYYFTNPKAVHYLRELARILGVDPANLSRELGRLESQGLFQSQRRGKERLYRLNPRYPLYQEVKRIVAKTVGVVPTLQSELSRVPGLEQAWLYGSFARNQQDAASDIDILLVGRPSAEKLAQVVRRVERQLGREINYVVLSPAEFAARRKKGDAFLSDILRNKRIELVSAA